VFKFVAAVSLRDWEKESLANSDAYKLRMPIVATVAISPPLSDVGF
jgi:hypothetical protein